jgi:pimeloyl-ACP methyl ester carboxylesterase
MGQVHFRDLGPRDANPPVLLLHMTPQSMLQFADVQPALATLGVRSIAVDTPGYGLSDPPSTLPTIAGFADNLIAVLDYLKIQKAVVAGHHTGASVATAFAVRHPDRVSAVILHGVPIFNRQEIEIRLKAQRDSPDLHMLKADGSHMARFFHGTADGQTQSPDLLRIQTYLAIDFFRQGPDVGHNAVFTYAMLNDLKNIKAPGLILSDLGDDIHPVDLRAAKARPDFTYQEFSHDGLMSIMQHPAQWAEVVSDYIKKQAL